MTIGRPDPTAPTRWTTRALVAAAVFWGVAYLLLPPRLGHPLSALEGQFLLFGGISSVAVASALGLWAAKRLSVRFGKRGFEDFGLARGWMRFLRGHHTLFGWAAFAAALAHSLYFASVSMGGSAHAIAGWAALGALAALAVVGLLLSRSSESGKGTKRTRVHRRLHGALAVTFIVTLSLHATILAVVLALWVVLAVPTALVWRSRRARRNIEGSDTSDREPEDGTPSGGARQALRKHL